MVAVDVGNVLAPIVTVPPVLVTPDTWVSIPGSGAWHRVCEFRLLGSTLIENWADTRKAATAIMAQHAAYVAPTDQAVDGAEVKAGGGKGKRPATAAAAAAVATTGWAGGAFPSACFHRRHWRCYYPDRPWGGVRTADDWDESGDESEPTAQDDDDDDSDR